jgi:inosose dehydratase
MLAILPKYLPRINHVHLKDVRPPVIEQVRREGLSFLMA